MKRGPLVDTFLKSVAATCGCLQVSAYVPQQNVLAGALLIHLNSESTLPELHDLKATLALAEEHQDILRWYQSSSSAIEVFPSASAKGVLIALNQRLIEAQPTLDPQSRNGCSREQSESQESLVILGLKFESAELMRQEFGEFIVQPGLLAESDEPLKYMGALFVQSLMESQYNQQMLQDPQTQLIGRYQLQQLMEQRFQQKKRQVLMLVNPDEFNQINIRFDQAAGDKVLKEFAGRLNSKFRQTDTVARYGGATFAILLEGPSLAVAHDMATNLHAFLTLSDYFDGAVALKVNIGLAELVSEEISDPQDSAQRLVQRAEQALNSAQGNADNGVVTWREDLEHNFWQGIDRLGGIFTAKPQTDYRNMLLLWNIVEIIGHENDLRSLMARFVDRLQDTFQCQKLAVIDCGFNQDWEIIDGIAKDPAGEAQARLNDSAQLGGEQSILIDRMVKAGSEAQPVINEVDAGIEAPRYMIIPMLAADSLQGILYFESLASEWHLGANDEQFIYALSRQLAAGMMRLKLQSQLQQEQEQEKRKLQQQVATLKASFEESRIVFRSQVMEKLLKRTRLVAASSATVLISGESGTGKELLAETVHQMGPRRDKPMVIVDCGAIPESLIESELFGHVKGAFTGANQAAKGRILEADGGTLILDEIGELPLNVQAKFLRFVQEKQVTAVGSNSTVTADVTLVAVTNRNLAEEVSQGRFREDLFYRLNVMVLNIPPLRERLEDIPMIMHHFNRRFARQFEKDEKLIDMSLCHCLQAYPWPGNVRELQNRMMQAFILSETPNLELSDFELPNAEDVQPAVESHTPSLKAATTSVPKVSLDDPWQALAQSIEPVLEEIVSNGEGHDNPMAKWLQADLILASFRRVDGVARAAARILGVPASSYRRKLKLAQKLNLSRPASWKPVGDVISQLIASASSEDDTDLLLKAETLLLSLTHRLLADDPETAADIMGLGLVTYRSRTNLLLSSQL